ncbi:MAG: SDR family NAD(P)-dependent oxidoreductase, partial [Flavobacteriales bacterium]|nr:SDR family NAD(P)-dependent oxidoreductase [Flavobacteriales bacterium]
NISLDGLKNQLEVNLYSAVNLTQLVLNSKNCSLSTIINIGSVMSLNAMPFAADYSISKYSFKGWNDSLRENLRKEGIKVSAIYPGSVNTSSWDGLEVDRNQMIQATDIAEIVTSILKMSNNSLIEEVRISPRDFTI